MGLKGPITSALSQFFRAPCAFPRGEGQLYWGSGDYIAVVLVTFNVALDAHYCINILQLLQQFISANFCKLKR
jgi:hypothetical protein